MSTDSPAQPPRPRFSWSGSNLDMNILEQGLALYELRKQSYGESTLVY